MIDDAGRVVTRYDKRRLSMTEVYHLYTPGTAAVVYEVDGFRLASVLCLEALFNELFVEYADLDVECTFIGSAPDAGFARLARAHAHMTAMPVGVAFATSDVEGAHSGIATMSGWAARLGHTAQGIAVADVPRTSSWRAYHRRARADLYDGRHAVDDPRSRDRRSF